jgi:cyclophilin family peptidyl-prolyl cis-trans isomerase/HEAT repeat protein
MTRWARAAPAAWRAWAAAAGRDRRAAAVLAAAALAAAALAAGSCRSAAPPVQAVPAASAPAPVSLDRKVGWILRLEHQRALRDPGVARKTPDPAAPFAPALEADLERLLRDPDALVRRRAALAVGRTGDPDGVGALVAALADPVEDVRAQAAFALGVLGAAEAVPPLAAALKDPAPIVRGRAAEGLGLIGAPAASAAPRIVEASADCGAQLASVAAEDDSVPAAVTPDVERCRLALFALVRLRQFEAVARLVIDPAGQPVSHWWPVAFALQRLADRRAADALYRLSGTPGVHTAAFALRGLAAIKDVRAVPVALTAMTRAGADVRLRVAAARALGQLGATDAVPALLKLLDEQATPPNLRLEIVAALGQIGDARAFDALVDRLTDESPAVRAAVQGAAARTDPAAFLLILSSLDRDKDWTVRAALASTLAALPADSVRGALLDLAADADARVQVPALEALGRVGAPDLVKRVFDALDAPDFAVRAAAARLMGDLRPEGGGPRLVAAYARGESDATHAARLAVIESLARFGAAAATDTLTRALGDKEWPVRQRAASLLAGLGVARAPARPAPLRQPVEWFESERVLRPRYSPHALIETRHGVIEIELNVVEAPVTSLTFIELARAGFYDGIKVHRLVPNFVIQAGDPRGDGRGGPGFTQRDEFSVLPYVRGTVGMALGGRDTGGSQFFIAVSPQPHLDGQYTVFGRVVAGLDLLDAISQWDVIDRVRIIDGTGQ